MITEPLVSVIIATYNQEAIVHETIESVLNQTYKNLEIIISDDASTDKTQYILKKYSNFDPRIKLFLHSKNQGITANYNFATAQSTGEFIAFFSGDDIMFPEKIKKQMELMQSNHEISFCHHAVRILEAETGNITKTVTAAYPNNETTIHHILRQLGIPGSMTILCRRSVINSPAFHENIKTASDWFQMIEMSMKGKVKFMPEVLCLYRKNSDYNNKNTEKYETDFTQTINLVLSNYGAESNEIKKSCEYALSRYALGAAFRALLNKNYTSFNKNIKLAARRKKYAIHIISLYILFHLNADKQNLLAIRKWIK